MARREQTQGEPVLMPRKTNGDPIDMNGFHHALKQCVDNLTGNKESGECAYCAGRITLQDKRRGSIGVFVRLDQEEG